MKTWSNFTVEEKALNFRQIMETYDTSDSDNAQDIAYSIRYGYENDPDWFGFKVDDLDKFESELKDMLVKAVEPYTMQDLADHINAADEWPADVEDIIERNGWVSDTGEEWGVCHNDKETIYFNEDGKAVCLYNNILTYDVMFNSDTMSDTMGFHLSLQECKDFIAQYNGNPNVAYFGDYKGGIVQIINNESKAIVFSTNVI